MSAVPGRCRHGIGMNCKDCWPRRPRGVTVEACGCAHDGRAWLEFCAQCAEEFLQRRQQARLQRAANSAP